MGLTAWERERKAKHEAWREINELKRKNAALVAERDALVAENAIFRSLLKMAQDEFIEAHSDGETDCLTLYDVYHAGPSQCLREIRAEATEETLDATCGEIRNRIGKDYYNIVESIILEYAATVRQGGEQ